MKLNFILKLKHKLRKYVQLRIYQTKHLKKLEYSFIVNNKKIGDLFLTFCSESPQYNRESFTVTSRNDGETVWGSGKEVVIPLAVSSEYNHTSFESSGSRE